MKEIPKRFKKAKFDDVPEDIKSLVKDLGNSMKGIYIYGTCGVGKTHIAYAIGDFVEKNGIRVIFTDFSSLISFLKEDVVSTQGSSIESNLSTILNHKGLLIIDDLGSQKMTEWVQDRIYEIVNKRYEDVVPTIFTSNLSMQDLSGVIGDRITSRIIGSCNIIKLDGEDRRLV
ncbi:MAG: ATP-binding protein [Candidatus Paceibacterota bacterium]